MSRTLDSAIVTTTIYVPNLLDSYPDHAVPCDQKGLFSVSGDKTTPPGTGAYGESRGRRTGTPFLSARMSGRDAQSQRETDACKKDRAPCGQRRIVAWGSRRGCSRAYLLDQRADRSDEIYGQKADRPRIQELEPLQFAK